jgi:putative flavoprotein involved in K+ transport
MDVQYIETLIVGAGQAGLSTGYHLKRRGRPFLIVDANGRVGDNWRHQWDTLRLYTQAKYDRLPGLPFPAPRWHCPQKDEVGDYLERMRCTSTFRCQHQGDTARDAAGRRIPRDG